jgi:spoIIIJ-associated protein
MAENEIIKDAINTFVISLEEEQKKAEENKKDEVIESKIEENKNFYNHSADSQDLITVAAGFEKLTNLLKKTIELICLDEEIKIEANKEESTLSVYGKDLGIAIGRNGQNIEAIEYIINLIGKRKKLVDRKIVIDIKDYRKKNLEKIREIALRMANKAVKEGRKIALRPMPSYERKIIHNLLSNVKNVKTQSRDDEPNRRIIIYPVQES